MPEDARAAPGQAPDEEAALWRALADTGAPAVRNALIERHLSLARAVAASLFAVRGVHDAEFADYMQYATLGLIEAVDTFDAGRGVKFSTFATYRIQGSIRNRIASFSERREQVGLIYRLKRERMASIVQAADTAAPRAPRPARRRALVKDVAETSVIWALSYLLEGSGMVSAEADPHYVENFYDGHELRQLKARLLVLVEALPEQERRIVKYHYFQNLEFTEIARMFG